MITGLFIVSILTNVFLIWKLSSLREELAIRSRAEGENMRHAYELGRQDGKGQPLAVMSLGGSGLYVPPPPDNTAFNAMGNIFNGQ